MPDTFNWIFGRTGNPHNLARSCGGSSGGEAALIAMKGSILGIGTDVGGSLRIPSAFCGLRTIKPSSRRVPHGKTTNSWRGQENILSSAGPMARSLNTVNHFMKAILENHPEEYDSDALPLIYNHRAYKEVMQREKLVIGVASDSHLSKPMWRALDITVEALKAAGHESGSAQSIWRNQVDYADFAALRASSFPSAYLVTRVPPFLTLIDSR